MFDGCVQWVMKNIIPMPYVPEFNEDANHMHKNSSFSEQFDEFSTLLSKEDEEYCKTFVDYANQDDDTDNEYWGFWIPLS